MGEHITALASEDAEEQIMADMERELAEVMDRAFMRLAALDLERCGSDESPGE